MRSALIALIFVAGLVGCGSQKPTSSISRDTAVYQSNARSLERIVVCPHQRAESSYGAGFEQAGSNSRFGGYGYKSMQC